MKFSAVFAAGLLWAVVAVAEPPGPRGDAAYVGSAACAGCHADEFTAWQTSHHQQAMQVVSEDTVLGDFGDATFTYEGITSRFYRDGDRFMVRTDGPDGQLTDYSISHTFGVYPLQQYLVPFPGGRLQALDIAWDTRSKEQGGQRWYHLHPDDAVTAGDPLHWTGPNLNWNFMCADCHSTQLEKGYDGLADTYATTWTEISVGCEACHGPGAKHLAWAETGQVGAPGFDHAFDERDGVTWATGDDGLPVRSEPRATRTEIQTCARCHSRRSQLTDQLPPGPHFLDGYRPALVSPGLYWPDGQVRDEVYVWGSFMQSRMEHAGVTCSDCHDPHAAEVRLPGDAVCTQCHAADRYAVADHHFHPAESAGAECAACHMPVTTFMGVDERHEHVFRVPRPDLAAELGTPDACTVCHADQPPSWAAAEIERHHGPPDDDRARFARATARAWGGDTLGNATLRSLSLDPSKPLMRRASALATLGAYPAADVAVAIEQTLRADEGLVRLAALVALEGFDDRSRVRAFPLLGDSVRAVRVAAAGLLAALNPGQLSSAQRQIYQKGMSDYVAAQGFSAERPESLTHLGRFYSEQGEPLRGEDFFRRALERQPLFVPARVQLAQLVANQGRPGDGISILREGIERLPDQADLHHALGLVLVRSGQREAALAELGRAAELAPDNVRYRYAYALALNDAGRGEDAVAELKALNESSPGNATVLFALATIHRDSGDTEAALKYARELLEMQPGNAQLEGLVRALEGGE